MGERLAADDGSGVVEILVIEDDPSAARLLRSYLENAAVPSFRVTHAETLKDGLAAVHARPFDVALLDLGLPDARELEALDALRLSAPDLPTIVVTGRDADELASAALYRGAEDYLAKGEFDRRLLVRSIRYALERRRGRIDLQSLARQLAAANSRLESLLLADPLTELLNRRGLERALGEMIGRIERERISVLAFFIDLDDFKVVNDKWGHAVGDVVLTEIASRLRDAARLGDAVGRLGGDEFLILMPGPGAEELQTIAERLRLAIASGALATGATTIRSSACVAGVPLTAALPSLDLLISRMHYLLRFSKDRGKNCVAWEGMPRRSLPEGLAAVCEGLRRGEGTFAVLQPILRLADLQVAGFELLSRFRNGADHTPEMVFRFCAEQNMLALADHHCLRTCVELAAALPSNVSRHVNLFPSTLMSTPAEAILDVFPGRREAFCVELSEQQMLGDTSRLQERVEKLRRGGLRIACDDVGFGRSHLESLVLLEPDVIKLDKRCVQQIGSSARRCHQLERFIAVARKLGAEVIAEGIEREEDLAVLRNLGVEYGQGYLWGKPGLEMPLAV